MKQIKLTYAGAAFKSLSLTASYLLLVMYTDGLLSAGFFCAMVYEAFFNFHDLRKAAEEETGENMFTTALRNLKEIPGKLTEKFKR